MALNLTKRSELTRPLTHAQVDQNWTDIENALGGVVTPQMYGAVADGATNDRTAINAAITAAGVGGRVYFPPGTYIINDVISPLAGQRWSGDGISSVIKQTGTNKDTVSITVSDVSIADLKFYGHSDTGDGISIDGSSNAYLKNANIRNCVFDYYGASGGFVGCIVSHYIRNVRIIDCQFLDNNISSTGADIGGGSASDIIVTGCYSNSKHDAFVSISSVLDTENIRHIITNNIAIRTNETARSAILAVYGSMPGFVTVCNNIIEGFIWNGVYVSAAVTDADATKGSGGLVIGNNIIRYCGGEGSITAGIYVSGTNGTTVTGNYIYKPGKKSDGTDRTNNIQGIGVYQNSNGCAVNGNHIVDATGFGINLSSNSALALQSTAIVGNSIFDCEGGGIDLTSSGAGGIHNTVIAANVIQLSDDVKGINCGLSGSGVINDVKINDNHIEKTGGSSTLSGVMFAAAVRGEIVGNTIVGFTNGLYFPGASARHCPELVRAEGNTFKDCTVAYTSTGSSKFIVLGSKFINSGNGVSGSYEGHALGCDASGNLLVEILTDTNPASGAWYQGDRRSDLTPDAAGFIGAVCVTAGSPGTWKTFGAISA